MDIKAGSGEQQNNIQYKPVSQALREAQGRLDRPNPDFDLYIEAFKNFPIPAIRYCGAGRDSVVIELAPDANGEERVLKIGKPVGEERSFDRIIQKGEIELEVEPRHRWAPNDPWRKVHYHIQEKGNFGKISWDEMKKFETEVMMPEGYYLADPGTDQVARSKKDGKIFPADYHAAERYYG